jgi:shikimate dehydrogenase
MTRLAAVIGDPISHSRSPRLHGHWLQRHGIDGHYVPLHIRAPDLRAALEILPRLGFVGANVTLPHKEAVLALAQDVTPLARRIGSANTLTFHDTGFQADNTDAHGFTWNILDAFPEWQPRTVALIGAGGASRAVIVALQDLGAKDIRITNRNADRAKQLAEEFGLTPVPWADRHAILDRCDTLVNATTQGMTGQPDLELSLDRLPNSALVTDLIYTPLQTRLLETARQRGNRVVDGLGMLLHQAAPGFHRWFGIMPTVDADLRSAVS